MKVEKIERLLIGQKSRFKLKEEQVHELKKDFLNSTLLIIGAAGSIGKAFSLKLKKYNIKEIIFLDKDENGLSNLSRDIVINFKQKVKRTYICTDLNNTNFKKIINDFKVTHLFNFAALKHVRTEEDIYSVNYLIRTNLLTFFKNKKIYDNKKLKKIFFISTDKAANPSSIMGCSKKIMENELYKLKTNFKKKFVSTVRFANVTFSNGSILKNVRERILNCEVFGIPDNVKRYFITHSEAADLCLISLLKQSDGNIIVPSPTILNNQILIKDLVIKIHKILNKKYIFSTKLKKVKKNYQLIILQKKKIQGQKKEEHLFENNEKQEFFRGDSRILKIPFYKNNNYKNIIKELVLAKNLSKVKRILSKAFTQYSKFSSSKYIKLKNII
jgi:FlaA1/EpsC-like NDP-sugar epimerase